jgi:hypothetical protein
MGLFSKLQNGDTVLKSLKFGKDRPGGGDSGQPYIQNPIASNIENLPYNNPDFLLRGGINAPLNAADDVVRLTKYMFSTKNPSGLLFIAKQNLLSRVSPKTEASFGGGYLGFNAGIYTPLSTLAQAGVGFTGTHLNQKGIDPTGLIQALSIRKYEDVISTQIFFDKLESRQEKSTNRLITLWDRKVKRENISDVLDSYGGGPGSILGIGKTRIRFGENQRTGVNNPLYKTNNQYFENGGVFLHPISVVDYYNTLGASTKFNLNASQIGLNIDGSMSRRYFGPHVTGSLSFYNPTGLPLSGSGGYQINQINQLNVASGRENLPELSTLTKLSNDETGKITTTPSYLKSTQSGSLYKESSDSINQTPSTPKSNNSKLLQPNPKLDTYIVAVDKKYNNTSTYLNKVKIETRLNLGDPGAVTGSYAAKVTSKEQIIDKINGSPIYSTFEETGKHHKDYNDLVSFRIGVIDNSNPSSTTYMNFRAYIDSFSDSYNSDWKAQSYMGRGEKFYKYEGFSRDISLAFTVVAQSQGEMNGMYQKLNYLASSLAPFYTEQGYMAGNLVKLTFGNYIYEQVGFISSFTYDIPEESSWELSLTPNIGITNKDKKGPNPDELPFMIKVSGFKFTPIHQFRPEIQTNPGIGIGKRFITNELPFKQDWHNELQPKPNV